jgi:hypothetical protein
MRGAANGQAERSDGPDRRVPCAPAEERSAMGCARASCASSSDPLRLFELSERSERCELRNAAHGVSTAGCPQRSAGQGHRGRLLLLPFLGETRKASRGVGMKSPPPHLDQPVAWVVPTAFAQGPEAGMCARQRSHFLLSRQEKVTKEKATPVPPTPRCARGKLRCSRPGRIVQLAAFTLFTALRQARWVSHGCARCSCAAQATALLAVGTGAPGAGADSGHRFARPRHLHCACSS